jgi:hypothetical protein
MPPNGKLPASEITVLRRWVASGARYVGEPLAVFSPTKKPLWSFQPLKKVTVPASKYDSLAKNALDKFLFSTMQERGLRPSPLADKRTLLRRVTIDLTGLPPTLREIRAFLSDTSPHAYVKVVDRLLASPAYGERWGRHWLDVVRYGESHGYEQNHLRPNAWVYRDYVIQAFNSDKPYNQFVLEQLAADTLSKGDAQRQVATGFLVAGTHDTVPSPDELLTRQQRSNDLDDMVTTTGGTFLGLTIGCAKCHDHKFDPISQKDYYRVAAAFSDVRHGEQELLSNSAKERDEPTKGLREAVNVRGNEEHFPPIEARFVRMTIHATKDGTEPCIDEFEVYTANDNTNIALAERGGKASASSLLPNFPMHQIAHLNDGERGNAYSWISAEPSKGWIQIELPRKERINRVRWARDALGQFQDRLATQYEIAVSEDGKVWHEVASGKNRNTKPNKNPKAMGYVGIFGKEEPVYVLKRGDVMQRTEQVSAGALTQVRTLTPEFEKSKVARHALAEWLIHPSNPLTARVMVNRMWAYHFGRGIVGTPSDFGNNGELPSHPDLLDWLAQDFRANGWRMKRLHRMMVLSYVYQQRSAEIPANARKDADNRYLWRMPLRRLEAEAIRDAILLTSGKLDRAMGGPSYRLFKYDVVNVAIYGTLEEQGKETWRRCVYQQPARGIRDGLLGTFDCPDSSERTAKRTSTTTALQALSLLNGKFLQQQADFFAERVQGQAGQSLSKQVSTAFLEAFGRTPSTIEVRDAEGLVKSFGLSTLCRALLNANEFLYY